MDLTVIAVAFIGIIIVVNLILSASVAVLLGQFIHHRDQQIPVDVQHAAITSDPDTIR